MVMKEVLTIEKEYINCKTYNEIKDICKINNYKLFSRYLDKTKAFYYLFKDKNIIWKKINYDKSMEILMFNEQSYTDVNQQYLDNCWLCSTLASIVSKDPDFLKKTIIYRDTFGYDIFEVRLFVNGKARYIMVDNYFPFIEETQSSLGCSPEPSMWVAIIEKAVAQLLGSYESLNNGNEIMGFNILTGRLATVIPFDAFDWERFKNDSSLIGTVSTKYYLEESIPLVPNHTYSIIINNIEESIQFYDPKIYYDSSRPLVKSCKLSFDINKTLRNTYSKYMTYVTILSSSSYIATRFNEYKQKCEIIYQSIKLKKNENKTKTKHDLIIYSSVLVPLIIMYNFRNRN